MAKHVLSVGDLVLDLILPVRFPITANDHQSTPFRRFEPGGAGNFIAAARHLGLSVSAAGAIGGDMFGAQLMKILRDLNVDITNVVAQPDATSTIAVVMTNPQTNEHVFVGNYGEGPVIPYPPRLDATIERSDAIFVLGYSFAERRGAEMAWRVVDKAAETNTPIYLDVGPFMAMVPGEKVEVLVRKCRVILATEEEISLIADGRRPSEQVYKDLLAKGPSVIVVKQNIEGCTIVTKEKTQHIPPFKVTAIDSVGAGDCFDAAFIIAHLEGLPLADCAVIANAMGAASVMKIGAGRNAPTREEVQTVLAKGGKTIRLP